MEHLGRYLLVKKLAVGGMAEIFLAKLVGAAGFEKDIVVKRILPQWSQHQDFVTMLIDEAKIAVRLSHPNVVPVYELGREGEVYYIAMEYVEGSDVRRLMQSSGARKQTLPEEIALRVAIEVLEGLGYAHRFQIVHRDISPQNILVSEDGGVKITDFGIAKAASKTHETATGVIKGKFAYMSPEQASQEDVDGRSDLFSTAIVLYEMLTGERLFYAGSDVATLDRVRRAEVAPSPQAMQKISPRLLAILRKALARLPEDRYPDAGALREVLQDYAQSCGLNLRRERLAEFLKTFESRPTSSPVKKEEETRLMTEATALLMEETRTTLKEKSEISEVLVERSETRLLIDHPTQVSRRLTPLSATALLAGVVLLLVAGAYALKGRSADKPAKIASTALPPLPEAPKTPQPVEIPEPAVPEPAVAVPLPETRPETQAVLETTTPLVPVSKSEIPSVATLTKKETPPKAAGKGYLSVQAVPWGTVSVDGGKRRWETPVRRLPLTAGRHRVRVTYEPDGTDVASSINVVSGKEIVCVAKFRSGKELRCKN